MVQIYSHYDLTTMDPAYDPTSVIQLRQIEDYLHQHTAQMVAMSADLWCAT